MCPREKCLRSVGMGEDEGDTLERDRPMGTRWSRFVREIYKRDRIAGFNNAEKPRN